MGTAPVNDLLVSWVTTSLAAVGPEAFSGTVMALSLSHGLGRGAGDGNGVLHDRVDPPEGLVGEAEISGRQDLVEAPHCRPGLAGPAKLSNLKTIIYGGAPMYLADLEDALAVFGPRLAQIYGQGESPMTITALSQTDHADRNHPRWRERLQSVGTPRTDVEVRVVDDEGHPVPSGESGEVVVRGDVVMAGYWNEPAATAEALQDGWLHTGDVGSFDPDGYLTLLDRSKDLIISGGMNIYPREVEEALLGHPGVQAAAVVGRPDREWGEAVVAFIVSADAEAAPPADVLDRTCLDNIARYKRPKDYRFVEALPTNNYGKVVKRELRDRLRAETDPADAP